jgi:Leucine-rich repeat (LRR) protein
MVSLTYKEISEIGLIERNFRKVTQLHISNNKLKNLEGIDQFEFLTALSI